MAKKKVLNKRLLVVMMVMTGVMAYAATPMITDVTAQQRYPWNGKVDISYTVTGDIAEEAKQRALLTSLKVSSIDMVANTTNIATQLSGDLSLEEGTHAIVWDMDAEGFPLPFKSSNVVFIVSCEITPAMYCVIDLSGGANATTFPITYMAEPPSGGFNVDEYKTTKLVLRRIEAGSFIMGSDQTDKSHRVTLTKPFFCGIFEVTQAQYALVLGMNPCSSTSYGQGNTHPVHYVSHEMINSSFMTTLSTKTGLKDKFKLPTEAQWEYACRAGTTTLYSYGDAADGSYMWYKDNSDNKSHPVGTRHANAWGLYDMHGNVREWCLDGYNYGQPMYGTDPQSSDWWAERVLRGGCWSDRACTSSYRGNSAKPSDTSQCNGFRVIRILSN